MPVLRVLAALLLLASPAIAADANHAAGFASCNSCHGTGANAATYGMTNGVNTTLLNALSYARRTGAKVTPVYPGGNSRLRPVGYIIGRTYMRVHAPYVSLTNEPIYDGAEYQSCPC